MKHEIIKKTLLYRTIAVGIGLLLPILLTGNIVLGLKTALITESTTLATYYLFELAWRKYVERQRVREGVSLFVLGNGDGNKVRIAYNVIEVIDENKFVIEVI